MYFVAFKEPEQLRLQAKIEFTDFVQQQRAFAGSSNHTRCVFARTREGTPTMTKQLTIDHLLGNAGAVEREKVSTRAAGILVNDASEDFFASTGLSPDRSLVEHFAF